MAPSLPEMPSKRGRQRPSSAARLALAEPAPSSPFPSYNAPTSSIVIQKGPLWSPGLPVPGTRACLLKAAWGKAAAFKPSYPRVHTASAGNGSCPGIPRGCVSAGEGSRETPSQDVAFPPASWGFDEYCHIFSFFFAFLPFCSVLGPCSALLIGQVSYFKQTKKKGSEMRMIKPQ